MATEITCPNCQHKFVMEDAIAADIEKDLRSKMTVAWNKKMEELNTQKAELERMKQAQEQLIQQRLEEEKQKISQELGRKIAEDYVTQIRMLEEERNQKTQQLQELQRKELELLREKNELEQQRKNMEMEMEKKMLVIRQQIEEEATRKERELNELKLKELQKKLDDQTKLAEEMKRKAEQGSMQLQGEVQEMALEEMLRSLFPFDQIEEVKKGVKGADLIQIVHNHLGQECGKIIYESKRTQAFGGDWIEKLKADMRSQGADLAVIVTQAMPRDMDRFGQKDGVWICNYAEVKSLAYLLRDGLLKVFNAMKSQENKGEKMHLLYNFLTGNEFRQQMEAIVEGFVSMKQAITRERLQMEKIWKEREKQLDKVLLNTTHMYGSIKGIAGSAIGDVKLLERGEENHFIE